MLVLATAPAVAGHLTTDSATSFGFGGPADPDPCRYASTDDDSATSPDPGNCETHTGVSGVVHFNPQLNRYIGVGDPDQDGEAGLTPATVPGVPEPALYNANDDDCWNDVGETQCTFTVEPTVFPTGSSTGGGALCDAEVIDGAGISDESTVDGDESVGGAVPDGTTDDGGFGAVCHTHHYTADGGETTGSDHPWNTYGCGDGTASAVAHGQDWTAGDYIFVSASCNWQKEESVGAESSIIVVDFINVILGTPTQPTVWVDEWTRLTTEFVDNTVSSTEGCLNADDGQAPLNCYVDLAAGSGSFTVICDPDSAADDANNGFGGGHAGADVNPIDTTSIPPGSASAGNGVLHPSVSGTCADSGTPNSDSVATVFVYQSSVFTEGLWEGGSVIQPFGASPGTQSWVDSRAS